MGSVLADLLLNTLGQARRCACESATTMACSRDVLIPTDILSGLASDCEVAAYRLEEGNGPQGPIDALALLRLAAGAGQSSEQLLIVTQRDLQMRPLQSLFGFANRRRGVAVVSTARLGDSEDPLLARRRLRNVAAHELGHLKGMRHCRGPQCLMTPVTTSEEIDLRPLKPCGRCPTRAGWIGRMLAAVAAVVIVALVVAGIDRIASLMASPVPDFPFT
jgi:predicted Zn-dependent protease